MAYHDASVHSDINGQEHTLNLDHRTTLLDVRREHLDLPGAKRACDRGECRACTVPLDEHPVYACQLLAMQMRGRRIVTMEGLAAQEAFQPILEALRDQRRGPVQLLHPGFAVATYSVVVLQQDPEASEIALRWELVGQRVFSP